MATKKKKVVKKAIKKTTKKVIKEAVKKAIKSSVKKSTKSTAKTTKLSAKLSAGKKSVKSSVKNTAKTAKKVNAKTKAKAVANNMVSKKPMPKAPVKGVSSIVKTSKAPKTNVDYSKAITPLGDRLVVRVVNSERMTPGGLIIPDSASSVAAGYLKASVLAVGSGGKTKKGNLQPLDVKVGDTVLFSEYSGTKVTFNSEELQIIHESDVMGIVQN